MKPGAFIALALMLAGSARAQIQSGWSDQFGGTPAVDGTVRGLGFSDDGWLYAVGDFSHAGGLQAAGFARWNGASWEGLGNDSFRPYRLHVSGSEVYVAGYDLSGSRGRVVTARWSPGGGLELLSTLRAGCCDGPSVLDMATDNEGRLLLAGEFDIVDASEVRSFAMQEATGWSDLGAQVQGSFFGIDSRADWVSAILPADSALYIGGAFDRIAGERALRVARYRNERWEPLGLGLGLVAPEAVLALALDHEGLLYAGGSFDSTASGLPAAVAVWDGVSWLPVGTGLSGTVNALTIYNGDLVAAGYLTLDGRSEGIARWDGVAWRSLNSGVSGLVYAMAVGQDGYLYAGGYFDRAGDIEAAHLARWNGSEWESLNSEVNRGLSGYAVDLVVTTDAVYVAGDFRYAGGRYSPNVAAWRDGQWQSVGQGIGSRVSILRSGPDGALWAVADDTVQVFDGTRWVPFTDLPWAISNLDIRPDGTPVVTGPRLDPGMNIGGYVVGWDGSAWEALGEPYDRFAPALAIGPDGAIYIGGDFDRIGARDIGLVARWDGAAWQPVGEAGLGLEGDYIHKLYFHDGLLYAGGDIARAGGESAENLAVWDGDRWRPVIPGAPFEVYNIHVDQENTIYAGGSQRFARLSSMALQYVAGPEIRISDMASRGDELWVVGDFTSLDGVASNHVGVWRDPGTTSVDTSPRPAIPRLQSFPNPASDQVSIRYSVERPGPVTLRVVDLLGRSVATLVDAVTVTAGEHEVSFETSGLPSGVYVVVLKAEAWAGSRSIVLLR